ncbi:MAG: hypothetical protein HY518_00655 [Candidatus Aenigmarchaeota archaeon]|nr:hypothetical protein [Candidatus Aenigmarchaeota archaeon]
MSWRDAGAALLTADFYRNEADNKLGSGRLAAAMECYRTAEKHYLEALGDDENVLREFLDPPKRAARDGLEYTCRKIKELLPAVPAAAVQPKGRTLTIYHRDRDGFACSYRLRPEDAIDASDICGNCGNLLDTEKSRSGLPNHLKGVIFCRESR